MLHNGWDGRMWVLHKTGWAAGQGGHWGHSRGIPAHARHAVKAPRLFITFSWKTENVLSTLQRWIHDTCLFLAVLTGYTTPVAFLFLSPEKQVNTDLRQIIILHALGASGVQQHAPGDTGMVWSITLWKTQKWQAPLVGNVLFFFFFLF